MTAQLAVNATASQDDRRQVFNYYVDARTINIFELHGFGPLTSPQLLKRPLPVKFKELGNGDATMYLDRQRFCKDRDGQLCVDLKQRHDDERPTIHSVLLSSLTFTHLAEPANASPSAPSNALSYARTADGCRYERADDAWYVPYVPPQQKKRALLAVPTSAPQHRKRSRR